MSYNNIFNPLTNEFVNINTTEGISVLKKYIYYFQNGGSKKTQSGSKKSKGGSKKDNMNKIIKEAEKKEKLRKEEQEKEARKLATIRLRELKTELEKNPELSPKEIKVKLTEQWPILYYDEYGKLQKEYENSLLRMPAGAGDYYDSDSEESDDDQRNLREEGEYDLGGYLHNRASSDSRE